MSNLHLHHLRQSRSFRILWLLEELGLDYQLTSYERHHGLAPKSLKQIHPLGKAPILLDSEKKLVESAVIIEYLIDHYDSNEKNLTHSELLASQVKGKNLRPDYGTPEYENYRYWLHFAESSLMPLLVMQLMLDTMLAKSPFPIKPITKMLRGNVKKGYLDNSLNAQLVWIDQHLGKNAWFAGDSFSGADIQMAFGLDSRVEQGKIDPKYANIHNWLKKCQARPAYQRAAAKK